MSTWLVHPSIHNLFFLSLECCGELCPILADIRRKAGYTLGRQLITGPLSKKQTTVVSNQPFPQSAWLWEEVPRENPHKHRENMHPCPNKKSNQGTFLQWGNSANPNICNVFFCRFYSSLWWHCSIIVSLIARIKGFLSFWKPWFTFNNNVVFPDNHSQL